MQSLNKKGMKSFGVTDYSNEVPQKLGTEGWTMDGGSGPTIRPAFAKAMQVKQKAW